jgi:hypothetical protein
MTPTEGLPSQHQGDWPRRERTFSRQRSLGSAANLVGGEVLFRHLQAAFPKLLQPWTGVQSLGAVRLQVEDVDFAQFPPQGALEVCQNALEDRGDKGNPH